MKIHFVEYGDDRNIWPQPLTIRAALVAVADMQREGLEPRLLQLRLTADQIRQLSVEIDMLGSGTAPIEPPTTAIAGPGESPNRK